MSLLVVQELPDGLYLSRLRSTDRERQDGHDYVARCPVEPQALPFLERLRDTNRGGEVPVASASEQSL